MDIAQILSASRQAAEQLHFPPFVGPERESTPLNATPYIAHVDEVGEGGFLSNRAAFVGQLRVALEQIRKLDAIPIAALLGGSAIGAKLAPADLDCVVFYKARPNGQLRTEGFATLQRNMKQRKIDVRFVPIDGDPLLLLKAVSYFTILYSKGREDLSIVRGLVLLDCRHKSGREI